MDNQGIRNYIILSTQTKTRIINDSSSTQMLMLAMEKEALQRQRSYRSRATFLKQMDTGVDFSL